MAASAAGGSVARGALFRERGDDRLVERIGFAREIPILAHQLGEPVAAGGQTHRELVDSGGRGRLRAPLDHVERLVEGGLRRQQLLLLCVAQHGQRHTQLRAAAHHRAFHQRQGIRRAALG